MSLLPSPFSIPTHPRNRQRFLSSWKPVPLSPAVPIPEIRGNIVYFGLFSSKSDFTTPIFEDLVGDQIWYVLLILSVQEWETFVLSMVFLVLFQFWSMYFQDLGEIYWAFGIRPWCHVFVCRLMIDIPSRVSLWNLLRFVSLSIFHDYYCSI